MSGYGYAPPPPPPVSTTGTAPGGYGRGSGSQRRGAAQSRGRGGGLGYHNGPRQDHRPPQPRYEYPQQPYAHLHQPPVAASYPPAPIPSYPQPPAQWGHEHSHHAPAPAPAPMPHSYPAAYPPQSYPPVHYSPPQQQVPYAPPPQHYPYGAPPPPSPSQWNGPGQPHPPQQHQQHHHTGNRSRGGYHDKGQRGPPRPPNGGGFVQPYPSDPRVHHTPQHYSYGAPLPAPPNSNSHHKDAYSGQYPRRGRGGGNRDGHRDGGSRGRGGHHGDRRHVKPSKDATQHKNDSASLGKKKKRKTNTLGLTPGVDSESEDDEGEEQALSELIGEEALRISDVAAFLAERRKNYPTKARTEARRAAVQAQKKDDRAASLEREADKLRRQLRKVESSIKRKREQGDEGDEMRGASHESSDDEPPESLSSKPSSTIPSRPLPTAGGKRADITRHCKYFSTGGTCGKKGKCRFVHDPEIRAAAIKEREANNGRLTIQQRLILNDKEQEDLTVLRSIQYLRQKGIMSEAAAASAEAANREEHDTSSESAENQMNALTVESDPGPPLVVSSTSPYQLPPPPPPPAKEEDCSTTTLDHADGKVATNGDGAETTKHYEGWLLRPYGSNGKDSSVAP